MANDLGRCMACTQPATVRRMPTGHGLKPIKACGWHAWVWSRYDDNELMHLVTAKRYVRTELR